MARVRQAAVGLAPVEVLTLVGAIISTAVVEALVGGGELLGVGLGVGRELVVPDEGVAGMTEALGGFLAG